MARALLLVALLTAVTAWTEQPYNGYRLLLTQPRDAAQVAALAALMPLPGVDLWERPRVDREVRLAVAPQAWHGVRHAMAASGLAFAERDLKSLLDREIDEQRTARLRPWENPGQARFDAYMRHNEIETYLKMLAIRHASASLIHIGTSFEGRNMTVIRIGASSKKASKAVFIDAGIHAREWIAPALAVYIIHQLVENATANADLLEDLDWYILPVANPDGYEYSHDTYRLWRKNRGGTKQTRCERGVDLNRNFGYHYGETGISTNPCSDIYAGSGAFSEKETRNMRDFLLDLNADKSVKMYLALHSYGEMILYPWGYSLSAPLPKDYSELVAIAEDANRAMVKAGSTSFDVMSGADLYPAAGASDDWAKGSAGIEKSYTVELQGGGSYGFDLPASRIARSVQLVFEAIKVFGKHAKSL